jgi:hypothetical protein
MTDVSHQHLERLILSTQWVFSPKHLKSGVVKAVEATTGVKHRGKCAKHGLNSSAREKAFQIIRLCPPWSLESMSNQYSLKQEDGCSFSIGYLQQVMGCVHG